MKNSKLILKTAIIMLFIAPPLVLSHGDNEHEQKTNVKKELSKDNNLLKAYKEINENYNKNIKPIFKKKCFDCHGLITQSPWYYKIPGVKQMIDYDIKEAKKHLDMSEDFPFISHETPLKDLESLKEVSMEDDMPPFRYIIGNWDARLDKKEKQAIIKWTEESILKLK